jgi:hypothetical protein
MKELLAQILLSAAGEMWKREPTLGKYTAETAEHELNLAFHYAAELRHWLPWLDCDFDVTKLNFNRERPDIILHRRSSNKANFLVIEIKRERFRSGVPADLEQIRTRWFMGNLRYRYGASLILDEIDHSAVEVRVLFRDQPEDELMRKLTARSRRLQPPEPLAVQKSPLPRLVDQIVVAKPRDARTDTSELEQEIDRHVYALYGLTPEEIKIVEPMS